MKKSGLQQYQTLNVQTALVDADPHKLVQLLMNGAIDRVLQAKGFMERRDIENKNAIINKSVAIIGGLMDSLDMEKGGELAVNLERLYDYMCWRLFQANIHNDTAMLDEVITLMQTVKEGWDAISPTKTDAAVSPA